MARYIELFTGVAAGLAGVLGIAYALFGQTGSFVSEEIRSDGTRMVSRGSTSMWETEDFAPITIAFFIVILTTVLAVTAGAWIHTQRGDEAGLTLVWVAAIVLVGGTILSLLSVGLFFVPAALLTLVAAVAGSLAARR